jgi:hypothetical protein
MPLFPFEEVPQGLSGRNLSQMIFRIASIGTARIAPSTPHIRSHSKEMMVDNRLVDGLQIEPVIEEWWLAPSNVDYAYSLCGSWLLRRKSGEDR